MTRRTAASRVAGVLIAVAAGGGCSQAVEQTTVDGQVIVPIDPARPGDPLFREGLDLYDAAAAHQSTAVAAMGAKNASLATSESALALADYASELAKFAQLRDHPALCPASRSPTNPP